MSRSRIIGLCIGFVLMAGWVWCICYFLLETVFDTLAVCALFILSLSQWDLLLLALAFACFAYACHRPPSRIHVIPRGYGVYPVRQFFRW